MLDDLRRLLGSSVQDDHSRQVVCESYIPALFKKNASALTVLDLGCGAGNSADDFRKHSHDVRWIGLDLQSSPEVATRTRSDVDFVSYDGSHMPLTDGCIDVVYSKQVLEHVRDPKEILREVYRVLKPGGVLVGSTSQMEPYHSCSVWNYTVYGFIELLREAGFTVPEIRPGIDSFTLIARRMLRRPHWFGLFWTTESPLNLMIGTVGKIMRMSDASVNLVKLLFCGQFCFVATKPIVE